MLEQVAKYNASLVVVKKCPESEEYPEPEEYDCESEEEPKPYKKYKAIAIKGKGKGKSRSYRKKVESSNEEDTDEDTDEDTYKDEAIDEDEYEEAIPTKKRVYKSKSNSQKEKVDEHKIAKMLVNKFGANVLTNGYIFGKRHYKMLMKFANDDKQLRNVVINRLFKSLNDSDRLKIIAEKF